MTGTISRLALEEVLLSQGLVTRTDLERLPRDPAARRSLADEVVAAGLLAEEQIAFAVSEELGYPLVAPTLAGLDASLVRRVPPAVLRRHRALPLLEHDDVVDVAFADPTNSRAITALSHALGARVRPAVATTAAIRSTLREVFGPEEDGAPHDEEWSETSGALRLHASLLEAVEHGAQALQMAPHGGGGTLSRRLGGRWEDIEEVGPGERAAWVARLAALVDAPAATDGSPRRAALSTFVAGRAVRLSASFVPTADGEAVTVSIHAAEPIDVRPPEGLSGGDVTALTAWIRGGEGVLAVNDADEDAAVAFVGRLLASLPDSSRVAVVAHAGTPRLSGTLHLAAGAAGVSGAAVAAATCRPDVRVVVPGEAVLPPPEAFLLARDGRRVVVVGAWRDADETRAAWDRVALPARAVAAARHGTLSFARDRSGASKATFVRAGGGEAA